MVVIVVVYRVFRAAAARVNRTGVQGICVYYVGYCGGFSVNPNYGIAGVDYYEKSGERFS